MTTAPMSGLCYLLSDYFALYEGLQGTQFIRNPSLINKKIRASLESGVFCFNQEYHITAT